MKNKADPLVSLIFFKINEFMKKCDGEKNNLDIVLLCNDLHQFERSIISTYRSIEAISWCVELLGTPINLVNLSRSSTGGGSTITINHPFFGKVRINFYEEGFFKGRLVQEKFLEGLIILAHGKRTKKFKKNVERRVSVIKQSERPFTSPTMGIPFRNPEEEERILDIVKSQGFKKLKSWKCNRTNLNSKIFYSGV